MAAAIAEPGRGIELREQHRGRNHGAGTGEAEDEGQARNLGEAGADRQGLEHPPEQETGERDAPSRGYAVRVGEYVPAEHMAADEIDEEQGEAVDGREAGDVRRHGVDAAFGMHSREHMPPDREPEQEGGGTFLHKRVATKKKGRSWMNHIVLNGSTNPQR